MFVSISKSVNQKTNKYKNNSIKISSINKNEYVSFVKNIYWVINPKEITFSDMK